MTTSSPPTYPTLVALMGPSKGMSEMDRAAEAPMMARTSKGLSKSVDSGVMIIWISFRKPLGKRGLMGPVGEPGDEGGVGAGPTLSSEEAPRHPSPWHIVAPRSPPSEGRSLCPLEACPW